MRYKARCVRRDSVFNKAMLSLTADSLRRHDFIMEGLYDCVKIDGKEWDVYGAKFGIVKLKNMAGEVSALLSLSKSNITTTDAQEFVKQHQITIVEWEQGDKHFLENDMSASCIFHPKKLGFQEKMEKIRELKENKVITEKEYQKLKSDVLSLRESNRDELQHGPAPGLNKVYLL